jgi:hypothetical protein
MRSRQRHHGSAIRYCRWAEASIRVNAYQQVLDKFEPFVAVPLLIEG